MVREARTRRRLRAPRRGLWAHPNFLRLWSGQTISVFGDQITLLALPLTAVLTLDAGAAQMGLLTAAGWAPHLLISLFAGARIDRSSRRRDIMIAADVGRALAVASVPLAAWWDVLSLEQLYIVSFAVGCLAVFFDQSYTSLFITIVPRELVVDANSKLSTSRAASAVAGPGVAGLLVKALTAPIALAVDAVSFLLSALCLRSIRTVEPTVEVDADPLWRRIREGLAWSLRNPLYRANIGGTSTINFFNFMLNALLVLYASDELGLGAGQIGIVFAAGAVGALVGAPAAPWMARRVGVGPSVVLGALIFPAPLLLIPLASGPEWLVFSMLVAAELFASFGVMVYDVNQNSIMALIVPYRLRGRVAGSGRFFFYGVRPLGALAGGFLGSEIGLRPTLWIATGGALLGAVWYLLSPIRTLRELPALAPEA